ncbi:MAG: hypothetical protein IT546_03160 [Caulobacteraceae bacterium]|nr:hypothetical protein [Caulobacteraceae bacterium]
MTLQDASDIAQVISAVAVVVSLIYVALEIRHNSYELRISTQQAQADAATGYLIPLGLDPMLEQIVGRFAGGAMTPVDDLRMSLICNGVFAQFQAGWEAARMEQRVLRPWWTYQERALISWVRSPLVQLWWSRDRLLFADGFRDLVDGKLAAVLAETPPPAAAPTPPQGQTTASSAST